VPKKIDSQLGRDYLWNTASSIIGSISMVVMLLVVTRVLGAEAGGIFSVATAAGQQFQTLGAYEVRPYQATDVRHRFSFPTYFGARILTVTLMAAGIVTYAWITGQSATNMLAILLVASLRLFDAIEDVFYGEFQRLNRLDIAGRANFFRVLVTICAFIGAILLVKDLITATLITFVLSLVAMVMLILPQARRMFPLRPTFSWVPLRNLLTACLPLALAAFFSMYANNAPKFAIQSHMATVYWGYYGFLFMPALAINILAMFIFRPLLTRMATHWAENDRMGFLRLVRRGMQSVILAFALTFIVAFVIGIPILNFLFGVDLSDYKRELLILVVGGAFNAASIILYYALTTMRMQRIVFIGYGVAALLAMLFSDLLVSHYGIMGASLAYSVTMVVLSSIFGFCLAFFVRKQKVNP